MVNEETFQYVQKLNPEMERYMSCMLDVKEWWFIINSRLNLKGFRKTPINAESFCLQFRMIVELIFLANFSSHEIQYKKMASSMSYNLRCYEFSKRLIG